MYVPHVSFHLKYPVIPVVNSYTTFCFQIGPFSVGSSVLICDKEDLRKYQKFHTSHTVESEEVILLYKRCHKIYKFTLHIIILSKICSYC